MNCSSSSPQIRRNQGEPGAVGTNIHGRGKYLLQDRQEPVRGKCEKRQLSQPGADAILATAEHEREADEANRSNAFHEVPGILCYGLTVSGGERRGLIGSLKSAAKEILRLQKDDFLDGAEALVQYLRLFDGKA